MKKSDQIEFESEALETAIQNAIDLLMFELKPATGQQVGDILAAAQLRFLEIITAMGSREQTVNILEKMVPYIRMCKLPDIDHVKVDLTNAVPGNNTVN